MPARRPRPARVHLGDPAPAVLAELANLAGEIESNAPVFCHGDFAPGNVLVDGSRVGLIDFDKAGSAEPAHDMACFLTHLWSIGNRHPERRPQLTALEDHMRSCYLSLAPQVSAERLALYEAHHLASHVLRSFPKHGHRPAWLGWARGQVECARNRLGRAAGRKGAGPRRT